MHKTISKIGSNQRGVSRIDIFALTMLLASLMLVLLADLNATQPVDRAAATQAGPTQVLQAQAVDGRAADLLPLQSAASHGTEAH